MFEKISESISKFQNKNALFIDNKFYKYSELAQYISNIRKVINSSTTRKNQLIGVATFDDFETYSSLLAILYSGNGYVPINPEFPQERIDSIIEQSGVEFVLSSRIHPNIESVSKRYGIKIINSSELPNVEVNLIPKKTDDTELAYLLFTSGSTGIPKGVPISRGNLKAFFEDFNSLNFNLSPDDRCLQMFDMTFDLSVTSFFNPLFKGACIFTVPPSGIKYSYVYSLLEEQKITFALMVPSIINYLRPYFHEIKLDDLRYSLFCGEALYDDIIKEWSRCVPNARILNVYGPTETTVYCFAYEWIRNSGSKTFNGIVSIGKPIRNIKAIVVDELNNEVTTGQKGELCLTGRQLTRGYWKNPGKNKAAFIKLKRNGNEQIFYKTGDLVYSDKDGDFMFLGRVDHQVKVQGFRIELSEIEFYAREFVKNKNVIALAIPTKSGINQIHLFVENYTDKTKLIEEFLKSKLPKYMIPSTISNIKNFPLNSNGKVDRLALKGLIKSHE